MGMARMYKYASAPTALRQTIPVGRGSGCFERLIFLFSMFLSLSSLNKLDVLSTKFI